MIVYPIARSEVSEDCPHASLDGYYEPSDNQLETLLAPGGDGRLNTSLRNDSLVQWGNAVGTLASGAVFRLLEVGAATADPAFGGLGNPDVALAIADLAVTGSENLADFRRVATRDGAVDVPQLRREVAAAVTEAAPRMGVSLAASSAEAIALAVDHVVDRAMRVIWALHGTVLRRQALRPDLGWIAVNAERDPPGRPVNIPAAPWPTGDLQVPVIHDDVFFDCRIRYAVAGGVEATTDTPSVLDDLPDTRTPPSIPADTLVLVFIHGHPSLLEEGVPFYEAILAEHEHGVFRHPFAMIAFDFPTYGYSQYIDHDTLSPLETTTNYSPDRPLDRRFGLLEFFEKVIIRFIEELDERMVAAGHEGILHRIAAVIGGSMGGNLALRLSEQLVIRRAWLGALVAWSPGSSYPSFGRADSFTPSPGEHFDPFGKEALDRARERCTASESAGARREFMDLQLQGERLINDGTTGFELGVRLLAFLAPALVGGLAPVLIPGGPFASGLVGPLMLGSAAVEGAANVMVVKQADEWLRDDCREGYDSAAAGRAFALTLHELYCARRRRMHWRISYEQLLFSHQDEVAASRGVPCYEASVIPTLLVAGANDVVDRDRFNIFGGVRDIAPLMTANPGWTRLLAETGHSIHAERPRWLAREIHRFLEDLRPRTRVIAVHREGGRIAALEFGPLWKPMPVGEAIRRIEGSGGNSRLHLVGPDGNANPIRVRRYLTTVPDEHTDNNLRSLLPTTLPMPSDDDRAPPEGFQVTHVRVRDSGRDLPEESWISHLCNDALGLQVSIHNAEIGVATGYGRYFIRTENGDNELVYVQYLTTAPDSSLENNLAALPNA